MSRLGPHVIQASDSAMTWAGHAPVVKAVDNPAPLRAAHPDAITVYRRFEADSEMNAQIAALDVSHFADLVEGGLAGCRPDYVEGYNEVAQRQGGGLEQYAAWTVDYVAEVERRGLAKRGVLGFSFSVGNPGLACFGDKDDFQYLYNIVGHNGQRFCGVAAVAYHSYWGPRGLDEYYALRYRAMHRAVPSHPPFVLSECGRDAVEGGGRGWKASGITGAQYLAELALFDTEITKDAYVLGATVFTAGASVDWQAYSTDGLDVSRFYSFAATTASISTATTTQGAGGGTMGTTSTMTEAQVQAALEAAGVADGSDAEVQIWDDAMGQGSCAANDFNCVATYCASEVVWEAFQQRFGLGQITLFGQVYGKTNGENYVAVNPEDPVIVALKQEIADQTEGLRRVVEGKYQGAAGAAAIVVALEGGSDPTITPQPDYVPKA